MVKKAMNVIENYVKNIICQEKISEFTFLKVLIPVKYKLVLCKSTVFYDPIKTPIKVKRISSSNKIFHDPIKYI